jgi:hypothetical protein
VTKISIFGNEVYNRILRSLIRLLEYFWLIARLVISSLLLPIPLKFSQRQKLDDKLHLHIMSDLPEVVALKDSRLSTPEQPCSSSLEIEHDGGSDIDSDIGSDAEFNQISDFDSEFDSDTPTCQRILDALLLQVRSRTFLATLMEDKKDLKEYGAFANRPRLQPGNMATEFQRSAWHSLDRLREIDDYQRKEGFRMVIASIGLARASGSEAVTTDIEKKAIEQAKQWEKLITPDTLTSGILRCLPTAAIKFMYVSAFFSVLNLWL